MLSEDLVEAQIASERETIDQGLENYRERTTRDVKREGFDKHKEVQGLIRGSIALVSKGLAEWVEKASKVRGVKGLGLKALQQLDPDVVAAIGMTSVFAQIGLDGSVASTTRNIGSRVEIELEAKALEAKSPKDAKALLKLAAGSLSAAAQTRRFKALVKDREVNLGWSDDDRVLVGQVVLNVILKELDEIFLLRTVFQNNKRSVLVELTEAACEALVDMEDDAALQHLPLLPMVAPPRPWESLTTGAYYDYRLARLVPLVRTGSKEHKRMLKAAIADGSMSEVLEALNAMQSTRWAIDTRILEVVDWVRIEGLKPGRTFPDAKIPDAISEIPEEQWQTMSSEERTARSRQRRSIRSLRQSIGVNQKGLRQDLATARWLAGFECFYLPHSLDFRGRTYAVPHFNHQRTDHIKALFRFADAVPLGAAGSVWLMVHLANTGDFGKVSKRPIGERLDWVAENEDFILSVARDPRGTFAKWSEADQPFCFLQACLEYAEWAQSGFDPEFPSTIAGAADGSCSGLQHYSAITRSADEAFHVNLLPRHDVGDIYQVVADAALPTLEAAAKGGDKACQIILANDFGRSQVKRNVMTYFYGSAKYGMRDQHMQDLMRPLSDQVALGEIDRHPYAMMTERVDKQTGELVAALDGGYTCASTLAAHVYHAVTSVASRADAAAKWIQKLAAVMAHANRSMVWTTPTGFPVVMRYNEWTSKNVNLWLYDRSIRVPSVTDKLQQDGSVLTRVRVLMRQTPTTRVDKKTMRNASSPNVIHSMDAAHLHRSVARGSAAGICSFSMIHDSFGCHLGNMELFGQIIRESFVSCYTDYCPLEELEKRARSVLDEGSAMDIPERPERGSLDLTEVLRAQYAFA